MLKSKVSRTYDISPELAGYSLYSLILGVAYEIYVFFQMVIHLFGSGLSGT